MSPGTSVLSGDYSPVAVSASGAALVGYFRKSPNEVVPFHLRGTTVTEIPAFEFCRGISADGNKVVGVLASDINKAGIWSAQTGMVTPLGKSTWSSTTVSAVVGTDPVVVGYGVTGIAVASFRIKGDALQELPALTGQPLYALAASQAGDPIVGTTDNNASSLSAQALIWTEAGGTRTLRSELVNRGFEPPPDMLLSQAYLISGDGKVIIGQDAGADWKSAQWRVTLK
jgi:hypothetical protein